MRWTRWLTIGCSLVVLFAAAFVASCSNQGSNTAATNTTSPPPMDKITRGHYLVIGSSCSDCHTPGTLYGAPDTTRWLSGSELGWVGPWGTTYPRNLTPDSTGLAAWTEEQIFTALKTGHRPDGSVLLPPMPWQNVSNYSDDDIHAIAAYLKSIPPVSHKPPDRLPPGVKPKEPAMVFPPPPAWDAKNLPPPPAGGGAPPGGPSAPKKTK